MAVADSIQDTFDGRRIFRRAFSLIGFDWFMLVVLAFAFVAAPNIALAVLVPPSAPGAAFDLKSSGLRELALFAAIAVKAILSAYAACVCASREGGAERAPVRTSALATVAARSAWVLLTGLVSYFALLAGMTLLIIPGVIVGLALSVAVQAVAVERLTLPQAFSRSLALTRGRRSKIFGVLLPAYLLSLVVPIAGLILLGGGQAFGGWRTLVAASASPEGIFIVTPITSVISSVWMAVCYAALYVELRGGAAQDELAVFD